MLFTIGCEAGWKLIGEMSASEALTNFSLEHVHASLAEGKPVRALGQLLVLVNLDPQSKAELCPLLLSLLGNPPMNAYGL